MTKVRKYGEWLKNKKSEESNLQIDFSASVPGTGIEPARPCGH
jgi:hypothetical protein